jgi:hypothetical protein
MINTFVLAIGLSILLSAAQAQVKDLPGYIVRSSGDTIRGFLKEQGTDESAKRISFKASEADKDYQTYAYDAVKSYQYDGGNLFRAINFPDTRKEEPVTRTFYGKLLVTGEFDLYTFTEEGELYFIVRRDTSFYMIYDDDLRSLPYVKGNFRNELNFFALSCEPARREIDRADYSVEAMIDFFRKLDECVNPGKTVTTYYHKAKSIISVYAYAAGIPLGGQSQAAGEVRLQFVWPQLDPKVSFNLGFRYTQVNTTVRDPYYTVATLYDYKNYQITSVPLTVQYSLTSGVVQPFVLAGLSLIKVNEVTNNPAILDAGGVYKNYGMTFLVGCGIEARLAHVLWVRAEWRYEYIVEYPTLGLVLRVP